MKRQWWFQAVVASPSQNSGSMATLICSCSKFSRTAEILSFFFEATDLYLAIARVARILGLANWTSACLVEFHCWIADEWVSSLRLRHFVWKWGSPVFPPNSTGLSLESIMIFHSCSSPNGRVLGPFDPAQDCCKRWIQDRQKAFNALG